MIDATPNIVNTGSLGQVNHGTQVDPVEFFTEQSSPGQALLGRVKLKAGYGRVYAGFIAKNTKGEYVPYARADYEDDIATTPVTSDVATGATTVVIANSEATKYVVGDVLILANDESTPEYHDCGAITAKAVGTYTTTLTFTTATTSADFTVANEAHIYEKCGTSGRFMDASAIMWHDAETGASTDFENKGAYASIIESHAQFYKNAVWNFDSDAAGEFGVALVDRGTNTLVLR